VLPVPPDVRLHDVGGSRAESDVILPPSKANVLTTGTDNIDAALDAALDMTFPASDPVALFVPESDGRIPMQALAEQWSGLPLSRA